ncbi:hypothetical protein ACLKA6_002873 [Drosophila palustris]
MGVITATRRGSRGTVAVFTNGGYKPQALNSNPGHSSLSHVPLSVRFMPNPNDYKGAEMQAARTSHSHPNIHTYTDPYNKLARMQRSGCPGWSPLRVWGHVNMAESCQKIIIPASAPLFVQPATTASVDLSTPKRTTYFSLNLQHNK